MTGTARERVREIFDREIQGAKEDYEPSTYVAWLERFRDEVLTAMTSPDKT